MEIVTEAAAGFQRRFREDSDRTGVGRGDYGSSRSFIRSSGENRTKTVEEVTPNVGVKIPADVAVEAELPGSGCDDGDWDRD